MCSASLHLLRLGLAQSLRASSQPCVSRRASSSFDPDLQSGCSFIKRRIGAEISLQRCDLRNSFFPVAAAIDEDFGDVSFSLENDGVYRGSSGYIISSSEGEDSDIDAFLTPFAETDLPTSRERLETPNAALTLSAHRLATIQKGYRKNRTRRGVILTLGLTAFLVVKRERPLNSLKTSIPTIGGLFFLPVGITTARAIIGHHNILFIAVAAVTLGFAAIGLLDDIFRFTKNYNHQLPGWLKLLLHLVVGMWFSIWLESTDLPTPYSMKLLVPLPPPYGLVHLGKCYPLLTLFCFVVMPNGVHLTDEADGLVGGVSALAFVGMSIAVLPICPELAVFGASMAGASVGFLFHNRYKASILLGGVGSLGLGGALSAMAACTGMFFPLFISSGVFILEALSVVLQAIVLKATIHRKGSARLVSHVAPLQHQLKLYGIKVPLIVASAYVLSSILAIFAAYVGLISA
ncbi:phospho-N-acetylmuramoyl-pentapeptide-transferase homolog isoform X3 [Dendrobium catenatum]|uniref:phospho-N-acetylmuramoyl-pentapeptide- transferase homolog isoform X3 n=1 Tax=Dendrobium catenatum TaxID=906689 RepID=UPI0009F1D4E8|nr:phospho-N-acetylmuramoyl-pentapeptide-transferase homolog isoform X3 [Dendrobium catenatum]